MSGINNPTIQLFKDGFFSNLIQLGEYSFAKTSYTSNTLYTATVTFPRKYAFAPYVLCTAINGIVTDGFFTYGTENATTTGFTIQFVYGVGEFTQPEFVWMAAGLGA